MNYMGNTPMVKLTRMIPQSKANIYIKLEGCNPGGSKKARVSYQMILDAEKNGLLKPGTRASLIEPTGGNTGLGLTLMAINRGYDITLVIPDNYSKQNINLLRGYGARVLLSDSTTGSDSHIRLVKEIVSENKNYIWLDQLSNPSNPMAHYNFTGKEILDQVKHIDYFISAVGSGGTITGAGKRLKEANDKTIVVAMQPQGCDILNGVSVPHKIQGASIGLVSSVFDTKIVDQCINVSYSEAVNTARDLVKKEGLYLGISSCANVAVSLKLAETIGEGKTIVVESADFGYQYEDFYKEVFQGKDSESL